MTDSPYIGRFAPSPTGPLHFGSLLAAVASYLDARASGGQWLLRMEDLDPPREPAGTADTILRQLERHGFEWDRPVLYQSQRHAAYREALTQLAHEGLCFRCSCTRAELRADGPSYLGRCREHGVSARDLQYGDSHDDESRSTALAIRCRVDDSAPSLLDRIQGSYAQSLAQEVGDFVVRRKDGLFAYQLAVVVDDAYQGVTDVVRGIDLLDSTPRQLYLQRCLGHPSPSYAHIPIVVDQSGDKLSKQSFAPTLVDAEASRALTRCLSLLGQSPPIELEREQPSTVLLWGCQHWDIQAVPKLATLESN